MSLNSINYNRELGILNLVIDRPALFRSLVLEFRVSGEDVLAVKYFFYKYSKDDTWAGIFELLV